MRVLVTGGAGNLGQEIIHTLLGDGHDAVIFDQVEAKKPDGAISLTGSILDRDDVAASLRAYRIEAIIHLASMVQFVCDREAMTSSAGISPTSWQPTTSPSA